MQLLQGDLFKDFPTLKFVIPAWRRRGAVPLGPLSRPRPGDEKAAAGRSSAEERLLRYLRLSPAGIELMAKVIPVDNILFASEMLGAVKGIDPETGHYYDDTKRYIDQAERSRRQGALQDLRGQCPQGLSAPRQVPHPAWAPRRSGLIAGRPNTSESAFRGEWQTGNYDANRLNSNCSLSRHRR